jgi:uncharacterized protein (DUF488 family)
MHKTKVILSDQSNTNTNFMDLQATLELMHKRHEEEKRLLESIAGIAKPYETKSEKAVFTIGYEKRKIENFIKILKKNNIELIIDIRANGYSHKRDFISSVLEKNLAKAGIDYLSIKELGSPKELRNGLKEKGYSWFFKEYKKYLKKEKNELNKLEKIVKNTRSCLMCFELHAKDCHRSIVAEKLKEKGFEIAHL